MTALVDDPFRVFSAASQGDDARVRALLAGMSDDELDELLTVARLVNRQVTWQHDARMCNPRHVCSLVAWRQSTR